MRRSVLAVSTGAAAAALVLGLVGVPAHAAQSYTIYASRSGFTGGAEAFQASKCNSAWLATAPMGPNGIDSLVVNIGSRAGLPVSIPWSTPAGAASSVLAGGLGASFLSRDCQPVGASVPGAPAASSGVWNFTVPAGAYWLIINSNYMVDVQVTV